MVAVGAWGVACLVDARGLVAGDGNNHVLQVKLRKGFVLDVDERFAARDGGPAVDRQRHQALVLGLRNTPQFISDALS